MAFPGAKPARALYTTAQRVRDNLGKGQEVLRYASVNCVAARRYVVYIPEVDIIVVDVAVIGETFSSDTLELLVPAARDTAAGSTNRLIAQQTTEPADDTVIHPALLGLNGNKVVAGQPIIVETTDVTGCYVQVSYVLAEGALSY